MDNVRRWLNTLLLLVCAIGLVNISIKSTEMRQHLVNIEARLLLASMQQQ